MKRDLSTFTDRTFDLVVVGAGIHGVCVARDAALRGLSVALFDKSDFGSATSHNSLKIIHGGIRYFQHFDFIRIRESINERRFWMSKAPHLVSPLEFVIPTSRDVKRGPLAFGAANLMHRLIGYDWNRNVPTTMTISRGSVLSRKELSARIPGLPLDGVSGAVTWTDGQMIESDRILLECIESACSNGACVANYVECNGLLHDKKRVQGVEVTDLHSGRQFEIRCRQLVNSSGPWGRTVLKGVMDQAAVAESIPRFSKNMNIVTRKLVDGFGLGVASKRAGDGVIGDQSRLYFITPWKNVSVIGTSHFRYDGEANDYEVEEQEICEFIDEINEAYPPAKLKRDDVLYVYGGLTPIDDGELKGEVIRSRRGEIVDHETAHGLSGIISVIGVKYTTARLVAERAVDVVCRKLAVDADGRLSRETKLPGADSEHELASPVGRNAAMVMNACTSAENIPSIEIFRSCIRNSVENEMAMRLDDVIFRRTDLAHRGLMTDEMLHIATDEMSQCLNWDRDTARDEVATVKSKLRYRLK